MNDALQIERSGATLTLWLNRPELHNAFDAGLIARLTAALEAAGRDDSVRAVVLPGHGDQTSIGRERATNPFLLELQDAGSTRRSTRGL